MGTRPPRHFVFIDAHSTFFASHASLSINIQGGIAGIEALRLVPSPRELEGRQVVEAYIETKGRSRCRMAEEIPWEPADSPRINWVMRTVTAGPVKANSARHEQNRIEYENQKSGRLEGT